MRKISHFEIAKLTDGQRNKLEDFLGYPQNLGQNEKGEILIGWRKLDPLTMEEIRIAYKNAVIDFPREQEGEDYIETCWKKFKKNVLEKGE